MKIKVPKGKDRLPTAKGGFDFKPKKGKGSYDRNKEPEVITHIMELIEESKTNPERLVLEKDELLVYAIHCLKCNQIIYSRARHDYHECKCGAVAIDGGFDYVRSRIGNREDYKEVKIILKGISEKDLFDDWNCQRNKYGVIK